MDVKAALKSLPGRIKKIPSSMRQAIQDYQESYHKGVEKFGVWWTVFHLSMWSIIAVLFLAAILILVIYLPKAEMLLL
jgi:ABC-type multidrug transport system permease subunit